MKKKKFELFEATQMSCLSLASLLIAEKFLQYKHDPVGMLRDADCQVFCEPFKRYVMGEITFEEAQNEFDPLWHERINDLRESIHLNMLRTMHAKKTAREFEEDVSLLHSGDEKSRKEAAIKLVLTFPEAYSKNEDIKELKKRAAIEGDMDFLNSLWDAYHDSQPDAKRDLDLISFKILNEDSLKNPSLREEDVIGLAKKQRLFYQSEESLLKYLRRSGFKIKSSGKMIIEDAQRIDKKTETLLNAHKAEFYRYLFGDKSEEELKGFIKEIKKGLSIK